MATKANIIAYGFLFFSSLVRADDSWTTGDTVRQGIVTGLLIVDWGQTRYIAKHPDKFYEVSPALGEHPSIRFVNNYMLAHIIGHAMVSYILPSDWRKGWQYVWIGAEFNQARRNVSAGIKFDF